MRRKIPSVATLMAFEVAAKYQSFTRAADELALTEGAVSRQIAALENYLNLRLFHRIKKRVSLTDIGRVYYASVCEDLNRLESNTLGAMAYQNGQQILELAVIPTFATKWLIPRIAEFCATHADITVNLSERALPFLFGDSIFDAAVHYEHAAWAGNVQDLLFEEELIPVCSPSLLERRKTLSVTELGAYPLLYKRTREDAWARWFKLAGHDDLNPMKGARYDLFSMLIQAAVSGLGIALVPRLYVRDELAAGTLIAPIELSILGLKRYCIVYPEHEEISPALRQFVDWLLKSTRANRASNRKKIVA